MLGQIPCEIGYPVVIKKVTAIPLLPGGTAISCAIDVPADRVGQTRMRRADDQGSATGESCSRGPRLPLITRDKDSAVTTDVEVLTAHWIKCHSIDGSIGA